MKDPNSDSSIGISLKGSPAAGQFVNPLITAGHLSRKAIVYIRQSTPHQAENNVGSAEYQRQLKGVAASFGWPEHLIEVNDNDLGKSSRATEDRKDWQKILREISQDLVGAIFIVNSSRMARQYEYYADFRKLATRHNVLIFMDGRLINLRDLGDTLYSNMSAFVAEISSMIQTEHMRRSRLAKAKSGIAVSSLPVGWIKRADKCFDFDPEAKPVIDLVVSIFRQKKSLHGTLDQLVNEEKKKLPVNKTEKKSDTEKIHKIEWVKPSLQRVRNIITNPAYTGAYVYGKTESAPELGLDRRGKSRRKPTDPENWVVIRNHHPSYFTEQEQAEFLVTIRSRAFSQRHRPGRGRALAQGLVRCGRCGSTLSVGYRSRSYHVYRCVKNAVTYGKKSCVLISGWALDEVVEREILGGLKSPPAELLEEALVEAQRTDEIRVRQLIAEHQRLEHQVRTAKSIFSAAMRSTNLFLLMRNVSLKTRSRSFKPSPSA